MMAFAPSLCTTTAQLTTIELQVEAGNYAWFTHSSIIYVNYWCYAKNFAVVSALAGCDVICKNLSRVVVNIVFFISSCQCKLNVNCSWCTAAVSLCCVAQYSISWKMHTHDNSSTPSNRCSSRYHCRSNFGIPSQHFSSTIKLLFHLLSIDWTSQVNLIFFLVA